LDTTDNATNDALPAFVQAAVGAIKRTTCHSTGVTVKPIAYEEIDANFFAYVNYECHVPDLKKVLTPQIVSADRKITAAGLIAMTTAINATPADKILRGKFGLASAAKHIWYTASPRDALEPIVEDVMRGFYSGLDYRFSIDTRDSSIEEVMTAIDDMAH
ncbi:MAG: hypothetical protein LBG66_06165, partial [Gallionellaceae bacterium]|nr:hypothetical protein [Gallionellaceae bacterium]